MDGGLEHGIHHGKSGPSTLAGGVMAVVGQKPDWADEDGGTSGRGGHAPSAAPQAPGTQCVNTRA